MLLREVHAHGFGSLVDQHLVLGTGITVISGPNESGKSTWQMAATTALTGLRKGRQTKADRAFIERYTPWSGDVFAVGAIIEIGAGLYRVHRDLAKGVDSVFDERTGHDVTSQFVVDGTCDLSRLVGLDRRTLPLASVVRQGEILAVTQTGGDEGDALRSFLQRAAASRSDADVTAELAIGRIDKFVKEALGSERRNSTKPLRSAIDAAEVARARLDEALEAQSAGTRLRDELASADRKLFEVRAALQQAELADAEAALATQRAELAEVERIAARLAAVDDQIVAAPVAASRAATSLNAAADPSAADPSAADPSAVNPSAVDPSAVDPRELRRLAWELEQTVPVAPASEGRLELGVPGAAQLEGAKERALLGVAGIGVAVVIVAFVAAARSWVAPSVVIALACTGLAVLVAAAFAARRARLARLQARHEEALVHDQRMRTDAVRAEHERRIDEAATVAARLGFAADPHVLTNAAERIEQIEKVVAASRIEASSARDALAGLLRGRSIGELRSALADQRAAVDALQAAVDLAGPGDAPRRPFADGSVIDLRRAVDAVVSHRESLVAQHAAAVAHAGDLTETHEDHERAVAERDRLRQLRGLTDRTRAFLDQARAEVHREIAPRLASVTEERIARVTAGRYKELRVDPEDLSVRLRSETGVWRSVSSASLGTQEQVYLLLRSAIAELVAPEGEPCPLLLDEVTVHADDERLTALLGVVELLAETRQIVMFTQEARVADWARSNGHATAGLERP